jgi:hypothetical protein
VSAGERMAEASAAYVGDRFFPSTLATVVPTPADFVHFPNWCSCLTPPRARSTFPFGYCKLITPGLVNERSGRDIGVRAQLHFCLGNIFSNAIGKPIFNCPRAALCMSTHLLSAARFVASSLSLRSGAL